MEYIKNGYKGYVFDTNYTQVFKNKPSTVIDEKNKCFGTFTHRCVYGVLSHPGYRFRICDENSHGLL